MDRWIYADMLTYLFNLIDVNDDVKFINVFGSTFIILLNYFKMTLLLLF